MSNNKTLQETPQNDSANNERGKIGSGVSADELLKGSELTLMRRLWAYMRPYKLVFILSLLLLPIISGLQLVGPQILQVAIDKHFVPKNYDGLIPLFAIFALVIIARLVLQYTQYYWTEWAGQRALRDLRVELFTHVESLSLSFFNKNPVGRLMARMTTDVETLSNTLSFGLISILGNIFTLVAIIVILLVKDWKLALWCFALFPILLALVSICRHYLKLAHREIRTKVARLYAHLQESISGMTTIQLFARENVSLNEYVDINRDYREANYLAIKYDVLLFSVVSTIGSVAVGIVIWYGGGQDVQDAVSLGVLVAFIEYMQTFFIPIRDLAQKYGDFQSAITAGERIFQLMDRDEKLTESASPLALPEKPIELEFRNVWFAYKGEDWILRDVSFTVKPGQTLALVGHTGAGKTTIISLLLRLYDVTKGSILVNGVDIRDLQLQDYRSFYSAVLQDSYLLQTTIKENISLGRIKNDEEIIAASKIAHFHDLVMNYPNQYEHEVIERGGNLSAGEKQLLSFARAIVQRPEILILDEATANVDTETESLIQDAISKILKLQTSIVIAHRLSTIQDADNILVLHHGEVVEMGSHAELSANETGFYRKLYELQYAS